MPSQGDAVLIIGSDGLLGQNLSAALRGAGQQVIGTTRRDGQAGEDTPVCDLLHPERFALPGGIRAAVILAAVTDVRVCEREAFSWRVNVDGPVALAERLLAAGARVIFASSGVVYDGKEEFPDEDAPAAPRFAYARQKFLAEEKMRAAAAALGKESSLGIVRITRVVAPRLAPLSGWLDAWKEKKPAKPFTDLLFSPLSAEYVTDGFVRIIQSGGHGTFHFSGAENANYGDFCRAMARKMNLPDGLISPTTSAQENAEVLYKPKCAGLGMKRSAEVLGMKPQPLEEVAERMANAAMNEMLYG